MKILAIACVAAASLAAASADAADMLPLKVGIYVPANRACKGASNADMVNYWGKDSSIGAAQAECKIKKVLRKGSDYTIIDKCRDIQGGGEISGDPTRIRISSPTHFSMSGTAYHYCGTKVQF